MHVCEQNVNMNPNGLYCNTTCDTLRKLFLHFPLRAHFFINFIILVELFKSAHKIFEKNKISTLDLFV